MSLAGSKWVSHWVYLTDTSRILEPDKGQEADKQVPAEVVQMTMRHAV